MLPRKRSRSEISEAVNDVLGAEVSDYDQPHFLTGVAQRISELAGQIMYGLFLTEVEYVVLGATTDHEKLSLEVLDNETKNRAFALGIYKMLKAMNSVAEQKTRRL